MKQPGSNEDHPPRVDVFVQCQGKFTQLTLRSDAALEWLRDHVSIEGAQFILSVVVNNGPQLTREMRADGLIVTDDPDQIVEVSVQANIVAEGLPGERP